MTVFAKMSFETRGKSVARCRLTTVSQEFSHTSSVHVVYAQLREVWPIAIKRTPGVGALGRDVCALGRRNDVPTIVASACPRVNGAHLPLANPSFRPASATATTAAKTDLIFGTTLSHLIGSLAFAVSVAAVLCFSCSDILADTKWLESHPDCRGEIKPKQ